MTPRPEPQSPKAVDAVDAEEWAELLRRSPDATPFHDPRFARIYSECRAGAQARYLELRSPAGELLAGLPFVILKRGPFAALASGPNGSYGGPVGGDDAQNSQLVAAYLRAGDGVVVRRELIARHAWDGMDARFREVHAACFELDDGYEGFLRDVYPRNRRNESTRSERRGLSIEWDERPEYVQAVQRLYAERSIEWGQTVLTLEFWSRLLQVLPGFHLAVAVENGEVVGGHLCCQFGDELFAWIGTTLRRKQTYPAALLVREEVRFVGEKGLRTLNLGASDGLSGVASFKKLLGATGKPQWHVLDEAWPLRAWRRLGRGGG